MTIQQAAPRLDADSSTVNRYINHGLLIKGRHRLYLRATKVGRRWEISAADLKSFARSRKELGR